jgi:hypothetical protein
MEVLRESAPFIVGLVLPPVLFLLLPRGSRGASRFWVTVASSVVLGALISLVMGELAFDLEEAVMAIIIDTSLVFTASQIAYRLFWKSALESRLANREAAAAKR